MVKRLEKSMTVLIPAEDYYAFSDSAGLCSQIRSFVLEEYLAIRAGRRERAPKEKEGTMVRMNVGLTYECLAAIENIKKFYGLKTCSRAIRIAISNGLEARS